MVEVIKSILIKGQSEFEYLVMSDGPNYMSVFVKEYGEVFDYDSPLLYLSKEEARALSKALGELANGY